MPELTIRIKKKRDGTAAFSCTRADGSTTWQRQEGAQGKFFPLHDLTHYAVETVLRHRRGFYGLLAEGWDITDFGAPWPRGHIPDDADPSELIVGFLDVERASGTRWTAHDFNAKTAAYCKENQVFRSCHLTEEQLVEIRKVRSQLFQRWSELPEGESLELSFNRAAAHTIP